MSPKVVILPTVVWGLKTHVTTVHEGKLFSIKETLTEHDESNIFRCHLCWKPFSTLKDSINDLKSHLEKVHKLPV